jgi:hypothetical protein
VTVSRLKPVRQYDWIAKHDGWGHIDQDGVVVRQKQKNRRLYNREEMSVRANEKLIAVTADKSVALKAKDRMKVIGISDTALFLLLR